MAWFQCKSWWILRTLHTRQIIFTQMCNQMTAWALRTKWYGISAQFAWSCAAEFRKCLRWRCMKLRHFLQKWLRHISESVVVWMNLLSIHAQTVVMGKKHRIMQMFINKVCNSEYRIFRVFVYFSYDWCDQSFVGFYLTLTEPFICSWNTNLAFMKSVCVLKRMFYNRYIFFLFFFPLRQITYSINIHIIFFLNRIVE